MPCAKLLATRRPSAEFSRAARHIAQPCAKADDSKTVTRNIKEQTVLTSFLISANPKDVRGIAQSFRERERKQDQREYQRRKRQKNQIESLIFQMHKDCRDDQNLRQSRANQKQRLEPFVDRRVSEPES